MPKINILTIEGKKTGQKNLPAEIFAVPVNSQLMAQAVRVYLANQRRAGARAKTRGEVVGSGRKIWRQKGTGRARHGDRYAPIFVGGGKAHGPTGQENYHRKMNRRMKRQALFSALTSKLEDKEILVVKGLEKVEAKTGQFVSILEKLIKNWATDKKKRRLTIVLPGLVKNVILGSRNIQGVSLAQANLLNTYEVLNGGKIIFMEESIAKLKEVFLKNKKKKNKK
jgi:large subunit ribosomal protein L4